MLLAGLARFVPLSHDRRASDQGVAVRLMVFARPGRYVRRARAATSAIWALMDAALIIRARGRIGAVLTIERQQRLRDPRLDLGFMVEAADAR
jgi:hypothetical protein